MTIEGKNLTPEVWELVKTLFNAALEKDAHERATFLVQNCPDGSIRKEVEELLTNHDKAGDFLVQPAVPQLAQATIRSGGSTLSPGTMLASRFKIVRFIAEGGMGEVYEADDLELHDHVAIKTLRPETLQEVNAITALRSEVQLARKVTHPNVCRIYDLFRHRGEGAEIVFISMEFLRGETLGSRLIHQGRMGLGEALPIITQMASGLSAAHEAGIVHGDFKPGNVLLVQRSGDVRAVVTDFGLAFRARNSALDVSLSGTSFSAVRSGSGELRGTPAYMAPEQFEGRPPSTASDIYSLGLVMFEMLTGVRPFQGGPSMSAVAKRLTEPAPSPGSLEPSLSFVVESVITKCLDRDPGKRFRNVREVANALEHHALLTGEHFNEPPRRLALSGRVLEGDAFISYAPIDDLELIEGHKGWVTNLHRALEIRLGQLLGKRPEIWRDRKPRVDRSSDERSIEPLSHVLALIPVVSPPYVKSEWACKELSAFCSAAEEQGGIHVGSRARVFKVLKAPVPQELHPAEVKPLLGYEFFNIDPDTGRVREFDEVFGPDAQRDFWIRLDDLAHDICCLLEIVDNSGVGVMPRATTRKAVFLAETTIDLREQREVIKRELQQQGYMVLPANALPRVESELRGVVRADLAQCQMSIHLVGKTFSFVPEGGMQSLLEIQNELAIERSRTGKFSRVLWIPVGLQVTDERQRRVIEQLRMDPRAPNGTDLLETYLEDLKTVIKEQLTEAHTPTSEAIPASGSKVTHTHHAQLYLIYDQRDAAITPPWEDFLFEQGFEVLRPIFQGDEAEIREDHEENLRSCDGALILFGSANECWLRRKLRELQKSRGYGRTKPMPTVAICLLPPRTQDKERFRTHDAIVIPQWEGFSQESLQPLISRFKG